MRKSVHLAAQAAAETRTAIVGLSLGPYGASLSPAQEFDGFYPPPFGPRAYSAAEQNVNVFDDDGDLSARMSSVLALRDWHMERLRVFIDHADTWSSIGCVAFETVPLLREVEGIRHAVATLQIDKPWWLSVVFPGGHFPEKGAAPSNVIRAVFTGSSDMAVPDGIGVNCTQLEHYPTIIAQFEATLNELGLSRKPWLVLYPNGGDVYDPVSRTWIEDKNGRDDWAKRLAHVCQGLGDVWGGLIVGGCCRTGPKEIRSLASIFHQNL